MARGKKVEPPDWFQLEDYAAADKLDERGWLDALNFRSKYQDYLEWFRSSEVVARDPETEWDPGEFWQTYLENAFPWKQEKKADPETEDTELILPRSTMPIQDVTNHVTKSRRKAWKFAKWELGTDERKKLLLINLSTPDRMLLKSFKLLLKEMRQIYPLPVTRKGPTTLNIEITKEHFKSWHHYSVLACFDLDFYVQAFEIKPYTLEDLCQLLNTKDDVNLTDWGQAARRVKKEALAAVPMLQMQILDGAK
jgi:hypothetical protein